MTKITGKWTSREYTIVYLDKYMNGRVPPFWTYTHEKEWNGKTLTMWPTICYDSNQHRTAALAAYAAQEDDWRSAASGDPLSRDAYEAECARLKVPARPDSECDSYGVRYGDFEGFGYPIETCVEMKLARRRMKTLDADREQAEKAKKAARAAALEAETAAAKTRSVVRTITRRMAERWPLGREQIVKGELWTVTKCTYAGVVSEDDPSIHGSHLLGCEGDPSYDVTWDVR